MQAFYMKETCITNRWFVVPHLMVKLDCISVFFFLKNFEIGFILICIAWKS